MTHSAAFWFPIISAVAVRPHLWFTAVRQFLRSVPSRWWSHRPFLPWPDREYVRFRIETAYGRRAQPGPGDVVRYLEWCRAGA